jgi:branched-chain amino acid transport system substrate-binding protein
MLRRTFFAGCVTMASAMAMASAVQAQEVIKIGLIQSMSGTLAGVGRQIIAGARLYMQENGDTVAGKKIQLVIRDDTTTPDVGRRLAQDLIVNEKVHILAVGVTPVAIAVAPLATEAKIASVIMVSGTSVVIDRSPMYVRTSFTLGQQSSIMGQWAAQNGMKKVGIIQTDFAPGTEATNIFTEHFKAAGGTVTETLKVPFANPDFSAFLQRIADQKPDGLFVFVPGGGPAGTFGRQFRERGLDKAGIRLIGPGDITDDEDLPAMGDAMLGVVTAGFYSSAHPSAKNKKFVADIAKNNNGQRANFLTVGGYDGMHAIYEALKKTGGKTDGPALVEAMKGLKWESPRGPISIDPETRDIVQNIYLRRVERVGGQLQNTEFATFEAVKDPRKR